MALSHYPGERPHCYDLLVIETIADQYRATGEEKYRAALMGGWELYRKYYKHSGGATAICEAAGPYPPKSYYLTTGHNGETCGSVFWIWINHRLMQLFPQEDCYCAEIEEAIINIMLACRTGKGHTRYHNRLHGKKEEGLNQNSCCEVSSTNLISDIPEYIYSAGKEGVYINQYFSSEYSGKDIQFKLETRFPLDGEVKILVTGEQEKHTALNLRIPLWAAETVNISVNGAKEETGNPGSFITLNRTWKKGDTITFNLPYALKAVPYTGFDQAETGERYCLFYGPVLLALKGSFDEKDIPRIALDPRDPGKGLESRGDIRFGLKDKTGWEFIPYYAVQDEVFTCFPIMES
jgi:DUF1680 family protein